MTTPRDHAAPNYYAGYLAAAEALPTEAEFKNERRILRRTKRRIEGLKKYIRPGAHVHVPAAILDGVSRAAWAELTPAEREAHIFAVVLAQVRQDEAERIAAGLPIGRERHATPSARVAGGKDQAQEAPLPPRQAGPPPRSGETPLPLLGGSKPSAQEKPQEEQEPRTQEPRSSSRASASRYYVACAGQCGRLLPARSGRPVVAFCSPAKGQRRPATASTSAPRLIPRNSDGDGDVATASKRTRTANRKAKTRRARAVCAGAATS